MSNLYNEAHRSLQDEFGTRRMADRIEQLACNAVVRTRHSMRAQTVAVLSAILLVVGCSPSHAQQLSTPTLKQDGIATGTLEEVGMDEAVLTDLVDDIRKGVYPNRHSLIIYKNHKLVLEQYFDGAGEIWDPAKGPDIGVGIVHHGETVLHDVRSVSKSVVSACVGIALAQGLIKNVDQPVFDFFDEYQQYNNGGREKLTIKHLLTMTSGLDWNEKVSYLDPANSETLMDYNKDPWGFVLSRRLVTEPGTSWDYNGGCSEILAAIVQKASGKNIHEFAREYLFKPLGIERSEWNKFLHFDAPMGASGLRLTARDMLKFGILYQDEGRWGGQQILRMEWVRDSFAPAISRPGGGAYGYLFWLFDFSVNGAGMRSPAAVGNGDQCIFFDRKNDLVMVSTAGHYDKDVGKNSALIRNRIYQAFRFEPTGE